MPLYGQVFLEEMWRFYGHKGKRAYFIERWIPFIVDTADHFREDFITIWQRELVQGRWRKTNIFMRPCDPRNPGRNLHHVPADGSWNGDGLEVRRKPPGQPHELDVALRFPLQSAA